MPAWPPSDGALDHQRVEALRGAVDRRAEAGRPTADDQQVDLLALLELETDSERPRELAVARPSQLAAARKAHERDVGCVELLDQRRRLRVLLGVDPGVGKPQAPGEVHQPTRLARLAWADDLDPDPLALLEQLAPLDERGRGAGPKASRPRTATA